MQTTPKITFIGPQLGSIERQFETKIILLLNPLIKKFRAYLVRVQYNHNVDDENVALCLQCNSVDQKLIVDKISEEFKLMFNSKECLDVIFITTEEERSIRIVAPPFYTSPEYSYSIPDFYLGSTDSKQFSTIRSCYKNSIIYGEHDLIYLLCDIKPTYVKNVSPTKNQEYTQIVLACRYTGSSLFNIKEWPFSAHISVLTIPSESIMPIDNISNDAIKRIAWGEVYNDINLMDTDIFTGN